MFKYLPGAVYAKLTDAMDNGAPLECAIADEVAAGMKRWATELGVTHYTHWFEPDRKAQPKSTTPLWNTTARVE